MLWVLISTGSAVEGTLAVREARLARSFGIRKARPAAQLPVSSCRGYRRVALEQGREDDAARGRLRPLSERALARLPGPAFAWIAMWALVPWANAGANLLLDVEARTAVWEQRTTFVVLNYAALSFAVGFTLWASGRIARRVEELREPTWRTLAGQPGDRFSEMNSRAGPLAASVLTALVFAAAGFVRDGWTPALLRGATWFLLGVALWTFLWTYGALQLGLDRLGRERLVAKATPVDPSLGLRPLGELAFTGLWMLLVWLVPVLLTALPDLPAVGLGLLVLVGGLAAFFLSLLRLHGQMVEVKERELRLARELYSEAYAPLSAQPTLERLEEQSRLLAAADSLEKRARAIHDWPIDEGTWARVITIATSVTAITIARLILDPLGL